jgi:protein-tyrosine phosphatase
MDLNLDWIDERLAIGGRWPIAAVEELAWGERIRAIVDLRIEECDDQALLRRYEIEFLHLPTPDGSAISSEMLDQGVGWVRERLDRGDRVLIHCMAGVGRSPQLALCILVAGGSEPLQALRRIKLARKVISPTPAQLEGYRTWLERYRAEGERRFEIPSLEELGSVAYPAEFYSR